jgi:UDP-N-acetyl-D-glucosamine dehydrogenase
MLLSFNKKVQSKECIVGIIGLGYVGLPLALRFCESRFRVIGFDVDQMKITSLNSGKSYIEQIDSNKIKEFITDQSLVVTDEFKYINNVDAIIICVPTPLGQYREPDLSFIINTLDTILPHLHKGQLLSLESTTYPGTTDEELKPRIENLGFTIGTDFFIVFSPEREDPGNSHYSTFNIPKIVGGITENCYLAGSSLYGSAIQKIVKVSSARAAELTKLLENIHRSVNIGLVNEMKIISDKMGIDIHEVIDAASTKPFGFVPYRPGPGIGGHCIPIDPYYLTWKAREYGLHTRFIELAGEINSNMPKWVFEKIRVALNNIEKSIKNSKFLILGIAYKKNVDDMRESPAVTIMEHLRAEGGLVSYSDPHVTIFPKMRNHTFELKSIELTPENIRTFDCVILTTDHDCFDYDLIGANARLLVDTRGKFRNRFTNLINA